MINIPSLPEGDIAVGEKARGYVAFEIPIGTTSGLTFKFAPLLGDTRAGFVGNHQVDLL